MTTLACTITPTGIIAPDYADILQELKIAYWSIFGSDAVLDNDSQDGQLLAIFAQAIYDSNQVAVDVYNAYSPATAQGANLASVVKINGLQKESASNSTAPVTITGTAYTPINNGIVGDNQNLGTQWALPSLVTIPSGGTIVVTATCTTPGAVAAAINTLTQILTPTSGWQGANNGTTATPGAAVETDAALRQRQSVSTSIAAQSIDEAIYAAIANLPGVSGVSYDDNDTAAPDANGVPAYSVAFIVTGGDANSIAGVIANLKTPGTPTYGTTNVVVTDSHGINNTINFFQTALQTISVHVTVQPLTGYTSGIGAEIVASIVSYINSLVIGQYSYLNRLMAAAGLNGIGDGETFVVTLLQQSIAPAVPAAADVPIAFNQQATITAANVTLTVL